MKISALSNNGSDGKFSVNTDKVSNTKDKADDFTKTLKNINQKLYYQDIEKLIVEVDKTAKKLAKSCTVNDLRNYKRAVKNFLKETIGKTYEVSEQAGWDFTGRQKSYILVKKVDESLEEISQEVLKDQTDQVTVLKKLDEIRGLLVDAYI